EGRKMAPNPTSANVRYVHASGSCVRGLRNERGWSQEELARKVGVNKKTVENIEAGKRIRDQTLRWVAEALEVPPTRLLAAPPDSNGVAGPGGATDNGSTNGCGEPGQVPVPGGPGGRAAVEPVATIELVIYRDFESFTDEEQDRLLRV